MQLAAPIGLLIVSLALVAASMWRIEKPLLNDIAQSKMMQNTVSDMAAPQISSDGEFALTIWGGRYRSSSF